jgi:hypothetical protein
VKHCFRRFAWPGNFRESLHADSPENHFENLTFGSVPTDSRQKRKRFQLPNAPLIYRDGFSCFLKKKILTVILEKAGSI